MDTLTFIKQTQQTFESISGIEQTFICPKKALEFTIKHFPFRFASAKSIVLVICKKCSQNGHKEMLNMLLEQVNLTFFIFILNFN
uniref:Bm843 n=1 Tax=Brugia malayi TaxID=6279 RepID=A0A1I9G5J6_BRUMA|nr:Bm843 [Brugia malayi]